MNTMARTAPDASDRAGYSRDFVAIDDGGEFSYHRSEQDLVAAFEYLDEAACIIDRSGSAYRLALDPGLHLILGPPRGPAEFPWLCQAWVSAQRAHAERHRLRRFYPITKDEVVSDLFQTLALERGTQPAEGSWALDIDGTASHPYSLKEVDRRLSDQDQLGRARVQDPFGHTYRPVRHRKHWHSPAATGFILYVEIPAGAAPR